jgi:hypothetical protein
VSTDFYAGKSHVAASPICRPFGGSAHGFFNVPVTLHAKPKVMKPASPARVAEMVGENRFGWRWQGLEKIWQTAIAPPGLEKLPAFGRTEIVSQFCSMAGFLGTNPQGESPRRGPDKAFRNPAPAAAVIPGSPANPGLCSSHAVEVWWPEFPATSPSFCAIYAPASQSSSLPALSLLATIKGPGGKYVFTYTQMAQRFYIIILAFTV